MLRTVCLISKVPIYIPRTPVHSTLPMYKSVCFEPTCKIEAPLIENSDALSSPSEMRRKRALESLITVPAKVDLTPVSGVPKEHIISRRVRIYKPTKNAMQEGSCNVNHWEMEFDIRQKWMHPLNAWTSSADPLQCTKVRFSSCDEAIAHCEKNGWYWFVDLPKEVAPKKKNYGLNFSWNRRTRINTR